MSLRDRYGSGESTLDPIQPLPTPTPTAAPVPTTTVAPAPAAPAPSESSTGNPFLDGMISREEKDYTGSQDARLVINSTIDEEFDPEQTQQVLNGLARLNYMSQQQPDDSELKDFIAGKLYALTTEGLVTEDELPQYGLQDVDIPDGPGLMARAVGGVLETPAVGDALGWLVNAGEGFTTAWGLAMADDENRHWEMVDAIWSGLKGQEQKQEYIDLIDKDGDGIINFREMIAIDPNAGEIDDAEAWYEKAFNYGVGLADTIGLAATDPTSYITLGVGAVTKARTGVRALEEVGGDGLVQVVRRGGIQALSESQQRAVYAKLVELETLTAATAKRKLPEVARGLATGSDELIQRRAGQQAAQMMRYQNPIASAGRAAKAGIPGRRAFGALEEALPQVRGLYDVQPRWTAAQTRRGIAGSPFMQGVAKVAGKSIKPRAFLKAKFGGRIERLIDDIRVRGGSIPEHQLDELTRRMSGAQRRALREMDERLVSKVPGARRAGSQKVLDDLNDIVRQALEGGRPGAGKMGPQLDAAQQVSLVADNLRARNLPAAAEYVETVAKARDIIENAARKAGLPEEHLNLRYMPRTVTKEGQQHIAANRSLAEEMGINPDAVAQSEFAFQRPRDPSLAQMTTEQANEHLVTKFGLPKGTRLFEDDPLTAFAVRGRSAFQAATTVDLLNGLTKEIHEGFPLAVWDDTAEAVGDRVARKAQEKARRASDKARRKALPQGKGKAATAAREAGEKKIKEDAKRAAKSAKQLKRSRGTMSAKAEAKGYVTVETPNGSVWMPSEVADELAKVRDLIVNDKGLSEMSKFFDNWSKTWGSWATSPLIDGIGFHSRNATGNMMLNAIKGIVNPVTYATAQRVQRKLYRARVAMKNQNLSFEDAMSSVGMNARQKALARQAREWDIMGAGFFDDLDMAGDVGRVWDTLGNNKLITTGRAMGSAVEHNARLAHYIHMVDRGLTPADAARSVRQSLFDYSDLTAVERRIKYASRFYTFMRKNTGYQLWALVHYPGRVAQLESRVRGNVNIEEILGMEQAGYSMDRADMLLDPFGMKGAVGSVDTPFGAATETLRPLLLLAYEASGQGDVTAEEHGDAWMGLLSGGPMALLDLVYKKTMKIDPFTKAPDKGGNEAFWRDFADVIIGPAWSSLDRMVQRSTRGGGIGPLGNDETRMSQIGAGDDEQLIPEIIILSNILGLNVAATGEHNVTSNMYAMIEQTEELLKSIDGAPTISELRDAGALPEPERSPSRTSSVILEEKIANAEELGLDTTLLEERYQEALQSEETRGVTIDPETGEGTSRTDRLADYSLSGSLFALDDDGNVRYDDEGNPVPSTSKLAKVLYSIENPDDAFIGKDGEAFDEYDIPEIWYQASTEDVRSWALQVGAPLSDRGNVIRKTEEAWNETFPDNPYYGTTSKMDRAIGGLTPIQGIWTFVDDDGNTQEVRGAVSPAEILGLQDQPEVQQSGVSALTEDTSGTGSLRDQYQG